MLHQSHRYFLLLLTFLAYSLSMSAQVTGQVIDAKTREPLDYVSVYYEGKNCGENTDEKGRFVIKEDSTWTELTIYSMGYVKKVINLSKFGKNKNLTIKLEPESRTLSTITVTAKRSKYSRKNNPAVELMKKVIANKKSFDLRSRDYFSYNKYQKMTFSLNDVSDKVFEEGEYKRFAFIKDHVERCKQTDKLILPLTIDETLSQVFYRKDPKSEKTLIKGESNQGVTELINTGEIFTTMLKDVFTDVDIYEENCRLLQFPFKSPIANSAISFYRYYLQDTLFIDEDQVIDVGFVPNNPQDFGFSGHLYILNDSSYQVRKVELSIPRRSDVNFVENMYITQDFTQLETGERIADINDMLIELKLNKWLGHFQVQRTVRIKDVSFAPIPPTVFKHIKGAVKKDPDAAMKGDDFWAEYRPVQLTKSESKMKGFMDKLTHIKGFKGVIWGVKAFIENFVEIGDSAHHWVDFGPVNTIVSYNHYDRLRVRASLLTNANLSPHFFASGYVAYGFHSRNVYGKLNLTYAFNKKAYLPREFPQNNLSVYYWDDVLSLSDRFLPTDKDNIFAAVKSSSVNQYMHIKELRLDYTREFENGLKYSLTYTRTRNRAVDALFFQPLGSKPIGLLNENSPEMWSDPIKPVGDGNFNINHITTSEIKVGISCEPGATYINTKQRRIKINKDAPIIGLTHTTGIKGFLGGQYNSNLTEAHVYKRFWLGSMGKIDTDITAGIQWNKVPFPLLIHPATNQSFVIQDFNFMLINNMEFLNDRYVSVLWSWDLNGKLFNRIPLLKKLKWREIFGVNILWGQLSSKNNPASSGYTDSDLFYFPGTFNRDGSYEQNTVTMDPKVPYVEAFVGIHNIFKILNVNYVHRFTYRNDPKAIKWGIRFSFRMSF